MTGRHRVADVGAPRVPHRLADWLPSGPAWTTPLCAILVACLAHRARRLQRFLERELLLAGGLPGGREPCRRRPDADAGSSTCIKDAGPGIPCTESLASYCAQGHNVAFPCMSTLPSVQANPPCVAGLQTLFDSCGPLELMSMSGIDVGTTYIYAVVSGDLIAVTGLSNPGAVSCIAGPPCLAVPSCSAPQVVCDAGVDALAQQ